MFGREDNPNNLPAIADFVIQTNNGVHFKFVNTSYYEPHEFEWDLGDGNKSTKENLIYSYEKDGTYTVTLKVRNKFGIGTERKQTINVIGKSERFFKDNNEQFLFLQDIIKNESYGSSGGGGSINIDIDSIYKLRRTPFNEYIEYSNEENLFKTNVGNPYEETLFSMTFSDVANEDDYFPVISPSNTLEENLFIDENKTLFYKKENQYFSALVITADRFGTVYVAPDSYPADTYYEIFNPILKVRLIGNSDNKIGFYTYDSVLNENVFCLERDIDGYFDSVLTLETFGPITDNSRRNNITLVFDYQDETYFAYYVDIFYPYNNPDDYTVYPLIIGKVSDLG